MNVFGSEMHVLTLIICILEFGMFCFQLVYYLFYPKDRNRFWYLLLLALLLIYNVTGGLLPDVRWSVPIVAQNIIAYGSGFVMASYFPYYFYRAFNLKRLKFHARYGVLLFLMLPYIIFFIIIYPITGNLDHATSYGMIVPFAYSVMVLYAMLDAIRMKIRERSLSSYPYNMLEMVAVYAAVTPWVTMAVFAYLHVAQWIEVLVTNFGFLVITILFISKSIKQARLERERLKLLDRAIPLEEIFEANLLKYNFTSREMEVIRLLRQGYTKDEVGEKLFIATATVSRHVQNIHYKTDVNNRLELMRKLEMGV